MEQPTVLVLGTRRTDNMPSLTRMLEILREPPAFIDAAPRESLPSGMHVEAPRASVRITTCPAMADDVCPITKTDSCPDDQSIIDNCYRC